MGCSPYFAITGSHPLIPLDISEATYLQPPPDSILSSTDLIARRAIALQKRSTNLAMLYSKVYTTCLEATKRFELVHQRMIRDYNFERGNLVLMRNTQIEKSLNRKMRAWYLGPLIVITRNFGGAYILCELDRSVLHCPVTAFHLLPYLTRKSIPLPPNLLNINKEQLEALRTTSKIDNDINEELPDDITISEHN
jgi:hypothetical protein